MPLKRKAFVVALGKEHATLTSNPLEQAHGNKFPTPTLKQLLAFPGVTQSSKGIIIYRERMPKPYFDLVIGSGSVSRRQFSINRMQAERLAIIKQLKQLGFRVAVPDYITQKKDVLRMRHINSPELLRKVSKHARVFVAEPPTYKIASELIGVDSAALWARDLWRKVGSKRVMQFSKKGIAEGFGEGGKSIDLAPKAILANVSLRDDPEVKRLQSQGYKFYFTGLGHEFDPTLSKVFGRKVFTTHTHVDLFAGAIGKVLLVNNDFFRQNRDVFRAIARDNGLKIVFVPQAEELMYPANFLSLGENKVLVDRGAKQTIALLRSEGIEVVPTAVPLKANRLGGGGIRCIVNEL